MKYSFSNLSVLIKQRWQLILIVVLAAALRFHQLGQVPSGFTWDEAAIGYNGYAIIHTRRDEWLERLPVSFRSFGDYKAPLAIYLNCLFTSVLGLNKYTVRVPFALGGVAAVLGMYLLTKQLLKQLSVQTTIDHESLALTSALLLAVNPWHLHFTRAGFESGLALMFVVWGSFFLVKFVQSSQFLLSEQVETVKLLVREQFWPRLGWLLAAFTCLIASAYTYHSAKLFIPLMLILVGMVQFKIFWRQKAISLLGIFYSLVLLRPMILDSIYGSGLKRAGTLVFSLNYAWPTTIWLIIKHLLFHLSPQFLVLGEVSTLRHGTGKFGVLLPITFVGVVLGLAAIVRTIAKKDDKQLEFLRFVLTALAWIAVGLLPAAMGILTPQANRSLLALPGFIWLSLLGLDFLLSQLKSRWPQIDFSTASRVWLLGLVISAGFYLRYYYQGFAVNSTEAFLDGYVEAFQYVRQYEKGINGKPKKSKVIFTSDYGQPYIYALFVNKLNPIWYQGGSLNTYLFTENITQSDLEQDNVVVVASKDDDVPIEQADKVIRGADGSIRFKIYVR